MEETLMAGGVGMNKEEAGNARGEEDKDTLKLFVFEMLHLQAKRRGDRREGDRLAIIQ
ncbi:hypothetical protein HAX54_024224, partial [Datura stramonium]|nr:hypothetical protein [Datura stramonium]